MKRQLLAICLMSAASLPLFAEGLATQQAPAIPENSFYQATINQLNQSADSDAQNSFNAHWLDYFRFSGAAYVDAKAGNQADATQGENANRLSVTNANLTLQATPNNWSHYTLVANYSEASSAYNANPDNLSTASNSDQSTTDNPLYIDQAYATFGDETRSPFFAQLGKQYLPFGQYSVNPIVKSLSQVLTETNATDVQLGFVTTAGYYASAYIFQNPLPSATQDTGTAPYNSGVVLGFKQSEEGLMLNGGIGYLNNMSGVDAIANYMQTVPNNGTGTGYGSLVPALAPYLSFQTGPFGLKVNYVSALSTFDQTALPYEINSTQGAKPSALDSQASYSFNWQEMSNVLFIGVQTSSQASALDIPKKRYDVGYNFYPLKNFLVGLEVTRDFNYAAQDVGNTSNGQSYYTYNGRVGVEF